MLKAIRNVYLTPQGKASLDPDDGKNTLLALQHTRIDDHTAKNLDIETLFAEDLEKRAKEAETKGSMLEQAKARQKAEDKQGAKTETKAPGKTEPAKAEGGK